MSYEVYKILHLISLFLFFSMVSLSFFIPRHRVLSTLIGLTSLIILISGFGLMGKLQLMHFPTWTIVKISLWLLLTTLLPILRKRTLLITEPLILMVLLMILSVVTAIYKY